MNTTSYNAGGLSTGNLQNMTISTNSLNTAEQRIKRAKSKTTRKKQLNYNPREIPDAIMRASRSQSAGQVLSRAKVKLSTLMKCKGTGQYNESQLNTAIIHAKRVVRCAQMKFRNLKQEERLQKQYAREEAAEEQSKNSDTKLRVKQKEKNLKQKKTLENIQRTQKRKRQQQEIMQKRRQHRNAEKAKLDEANMSYIKDQIRNLRNDNASLAGSMVYEPFAGGATMELDISGLSDEQIEELAEMMVGADMSSGGTGGDITFSGVDMGGGTAAFGMTGAEAAVSATVDVSV